MTDRCKYKLFSPDPASFSTDLLHGKNTELGVRRIQQLLAEWLRMENVVVLTAAGCSVSAGGRLMTGSEDNNLERVVLETVEQCPLSDDARAIIKWRKAQGLGKGNFENWLSHLFNSSSLARTDDSPIDTILWKTLPTDEQSAPIVLCEDDERVLCEYLEKAIYAECALQIDRQEVSKDLSHASSPHIPFLAKLIARDTNLGRTHLFTLNYDTLFEQALEELGIQYFDGFSGKSSARFDPSVYGLDIYYPGDISEGKVRRFDKFLHYYKLHGSLHWFVDGDGNYRAHHRDLDFVKEYRRSNITTKAATLQSTEYKQIKSFGILPTSQKFAQTLNMPYAHLFRLFHSRLNQPQTFFLVLGYGFSDSHVNRIIETSLMNPSLVMLVVEPNFNSPIVKRITRYQSLGQRAFILTASEEDGKRVNYDVATFSDFSTNIMPDVQWLEDFKQLRRFEEQIRETAEETGTEK